MTSATKLVSVLKEGNEDYEWYPTQSDMIEAIKNDIRLTYHLDNDKKITQSILDCGAGDGRVLLELTAGDRYAIEKSQTLLELLDPSIFVVGTDFHLQTLLDKQTDITFSNPPYSAYDEWTVKIISECYSKYAYLIIPQRWKNNTKISLALEDRNATAMTIGEFDFLEADRQARAKVDIVKISFDKETSCKIAKDPFANWFNANFKFKKIKSTTDDIDFNTAKPKDMDANIVKREGLAKILEVHYLSKLNKLINNYQKLTELDPELLNELGVNTENVQESLKHKISNLKKVYWTELFNNLDAITDRLTKSSRQKMLKVLMKNTHVDYSAINAHAIVLWAIKNANKYYDNQFVDTYEKMISKANILKYKSNEKTFGQEHWRYLNSLNNYFFSEKVSNIKLDYRIIIENSGGICSSEWIYEHTKHKLTKKSTDFINDLLVCASNLGFDIKGQPSPEDYLWIGGQWFSFYYRDISTGEKKVIFETKAYKNTNIHIRFNQEFLCKMNIEFGRLRGWIKTPQEASEELDIDFELAANSFCSNIQLCKNDLLLTAM